MEIWLRLDNEEETSLAAMADRVVGGQSTAHLQIVDGRLLQEDKVLGVHVHISDGDSQRTGMAHLGTVDWIVVSFDTWSMIPLENLIAHRAGSHTKIAAIISTPMQAQGAGFALEEGVDALIVSPDQEVVEAAFSVKSQRLEQTTTAEELEAPEVHHLELVSFVVESVEEAGLGDRYCLDFLSSFGVGEGLLVGSSAKAMFLVHSETIPSTFVPTRPFRVNAGSPHSYVLMGDGSTKYMAELKAGDSLLAVSASGMTRNTVLGRIKIEQRPMLKISGTQSKGGHQNANTSHIFMQQAETVRLLSDKTTALSVTEITPNTTVMGWMGHAARHVGSPVKGEIEER